MAGRRTRFRYSLHSGNPRATTGFLLLGALSTIGVLLLVALSGAPAEVESLIRQPQVTISPATSNKDLRFTGDFDQVFRPSSLHGAFRQHAAYEAVFETGAGLQRDRETAELRRKFGADFRSGVPTEAGKFPGKIVALSEGSAAVDVIPDATTTRTAGGGSGAGVDFRLTPARFGLISAIMTAYNHHCDLVIRPDDVWLTILAQFCAYVNKHAEQLRGRIVPHEGKKELTVYWDGGLEALEADTPRMIRELLGLIRGNIKSPELADWFRPGFSTTTENDEVSAAATAMSSLQAYFEYTMSASCGIPSVTLMGTVEDWKLLREKVERLLEFEVRDNPEGNVMEMWVGYLRKMCDGFIESAEHPRSAKTLDFWDKVLSRVGGGSGSRNITGWLAALTCFDKDGRFIGRFTGGGDFPVIDEGKICHNVVSCPMNIVDLDKSYDATLIVGGVALDARDGGGGGGGGYPTVRPRNDWCLAVDVK